jgi:hypothetical protein
MSMTSKVNPILRQEIVDYLAETGYSTSNYAFVNIFGIFGFRYSLRTIQEATQKMTKDGTLVADPLTRLVSYRLNLNVPVRTGVSFGATTRR